jgi:hypothetical protein
MPIADGGPSSTGSAARLRVRTKKGKSNAFVSVETVYLEPWRDLLLCCASTVMPTSTRHTRQRAVFAWASSSRPVLWKELTPTAHRGAHWNPKSLYMWWHFGHF